MGIFGNLNTEGLEKTEDRLGGFQSYETDAYDATIKLAYAGKSANGAQSVNFVFDLAGGKEYRETVWVTNRKGENWFLNQNDKTKKVPLPGFTVVNDICLMTTDKPLAEQDTEEKVVKIYDFDEKKEMPKSVDVLVGLLGQKVTLGILATLENKSKKNDAGDYEATAEERTVNSIDKVFHEPTKLTTTEAEQGLTEGVFYTSWVERNKGKTRDKREIKDGQAGTAGRPGKGTSSGPPASGGGERKSLFGGAANKA